MASRWAYLSRIGTIETIRGLSDPDLSAGESPAAKGGSKCKFGGRPRKGATSTTRAASATSATTARTATNAEKCTGANRAQRAHAVPGTRVPEDARTASAQPGGRAFARADAVPGCVGRTEESEKCEEHAVREEYEMRGTGWRCGGAALLSREGREWSRSETCAANT